MSDVIGELVHGFKKGNRPIECPKCDRAVTQLIHLCDDGNGPKWCVSCKKAYKKKHPNFDYSTRDRFLQSSGGILEE